MNQAARLDGRLSSHSGEAPLHRSIEIARDAGVKLASGSDVVGPWRGRRGEELMYKARVLGAHGAITSATRINAELFGLDDEIGTVEAGKRADLVLVKGQPLDASPSWPSRTTSPS